MAVKFHALMRLNPCMNIEIHVQFKQCLWATYSKNGLYFSYMLLDITQLRWNEHFCFFFCQCPSHSERGHHLQGTMMTSFMVFKKFSLGVGMESTHTFKCKSTDHTCLFLCINICWIARSSLSTWQKPQDHITSLRPNN